jgi:Phage integrase family
MELMIFTKCGHRKYLTSNEMRAFAEKACGLPLDVRSFCLVIAHTGCRISEALALTAANIDFEAQTLIVKCLKKRGKTVYRAIPLPTALLDLLRALIDRIGNPEERLWPWSRMTGYRRIREVMDRAGIIGEHASPKGLRHGFAVQAIQANVPLTLVQRWLGHADLKTTAIYTSAMGAEERSLAARMWGDEALGSPRSPEPTSRREPIVPAPAKSRTICGIAAGDSAILYQLQYRPAASVTASTAPAKAQSSAKASLSTRDFPQKTFFGHLLDCALIQFWLNRNSKNSSFLGTWPDGEFCNTGFRVEFDRLKPTTRSGCSLRRLDLPQSARLLSNHLALLWKSTATGAKGASARRPLSREASARWVRDGAPDYRPADLRGRPSGFSFAPMRHASVMPKTIDEHEDARVTVQACLCPPGKRPIPGSVWSSCE